MRIGAVRVGGDDRRMMGDQSVLGEPVEDEALDVALAARSPGAAARADLGERRVDDARTTRAARVWLAYCSALHTASKRCTRSAEVHTSTPAARTSSTVPASTRETYGTSLRGASTASRRGPGRAAFQRRPLCSSCQVR